MRKNNNSVWIILRSAAKNRILTLGTLFAVVATIVTALLPPLVLERIVNALTGGNRPAVALIFAYFGCILASGIAESARESLLAVFGQRITRSLRHALCGKLSRLDTGCFVQKTPGEIVSRFVGDVDTVENLFTGGIVGMAADLGKIISILAVVFVKAPGLAGIIIALIPVLFVFTRVVQKRMLRAQMDSRAAAASVSGFLPETLHCIRSIHLLGGEGFMRRRYDKAIEDGYHATERTNFYDSIYSPVILIVSAAVTALVLVLSASGNGAVRSLFGMSVGTAVAVISYISQVFTPLESIGMEIQTVQSAVAGVHRIDAFLAQPEREIPAETDVAPRGYVEFSHVTFGYDAQEILSDFSFTVQAGQQATLVGRTGAGKSTVFRLLLGLYQPESGSITIGGVPVSSIPDSQKRRSIGCVEQHFSRVPGSVLDQITLGDPLVSREDAQKAARLAGLDEVIALLPQGYDTPCTEGLFSQGQWQLLSIARAVAADPGVLLLDEITANLDARTEERVLEALHRASNGRTVLSISHRTGAQTGLIIHL